MQHRVQGSKHLLKMRSGMIMAPWLLVTSGKIPSNAGLSIFVRNGVNQKVGQKFCEVGTGKHGCNLRLIAFLNPKDIMSGLPWDILDGLSIAAGYIEAGIVSEIHVHPFISQITVLISGSLDIHMKDPENMDAPYQVQLKLPTRTEKPGFTMAATLASLGTFFQLDNSRGSDPHKWFWCKLEKLALWR
jgi:hypothetical protein